ncbi:MAG: Helix-turn-helix domain protein [Methanomassiliicoccales archaeon PtaU1.Bin124]|nr:MAG: Helix-turn-helix domain protein [Methanomassiliicoccales archaeon PtaU1.Bin124]
MHVKNKVRMYRAMTNLTQEELAKKLGVSRQRMVAIESESSDPSLELALRMARFFKVRVEDLFSLD